MKCNIGSMLVMPQLWDTHVGIFVSGSWETLTSLLSPNITDSLFH